MDYMKIIEDDDDSKTKGVTEDKLSLLTGEEIRKQTITRLGAINREKKTLSIEAQRLCMSLADPEAASKLIELTTRAVVTALASEYTTKDELESKPYSEFTETEKEFYDDRKYKIIYNLHNKVTADKLVELGIILLKQEGYYDGRVQRHKKKPREYVREIAKAKADLDRDARIAQLEKDKVEHDLRLNKIEERLDRHSNILKYLHNSDIDDAKIKAYRIKLEEPELTQDEIGVKVGKDRKTINRWFKEIKEALSRL